jgi:hypothetical protein
MEKLPETNGLRASSGSLPDPSVTPRSPANPNAGRGSTGMQPIEFPYRPALPALPTVFRPATPTHSAGSVSSNWGAPLAPLSGGKSNAFVPLSSLGPGGSTSAASAASRPLMFTGAPVGGKGGGSGAGASGQGVGGGGAVAVGASWDPRYSVYLLYWFKKVQNCDTCLFDAGSQRGLVRPRAKFLRLGTVVRPGAQLIRIREIQLRQRAAGKSAQREFLRLGKVVRPRAQQSRDACLGTVVRPGAQLRARL